MHLEGIGDSDSTTLYEAWDGGENAPAKKGKKDRTARLVDADLMNDLIGITPEFLHALCHGRPGQKNRMLKTGRTRTRTYME